MSLQHQRIAELCEQLKLAGLGAQWPALAQDAVRDEASFADFLEKLLVSEPVLRDDPAHQGRGGRGRSAPGAR